MARSADGADRIAGEARLGATDSSIMFSDPTGRKKGRSERPSS
jgi:hypothetical protein